MAEAKDEAAGCDGSGPVIQSPDGMYWQTRATKVEVRLPHLEEAAELLRRAEGYERRGDLETQDWHQLMRVDIPAWYDRDQALSAPTAESEPAPVAEAPRVKPEWVREILLRSTMPRKSLDTALRYITQQEQSEREVAKLRNASQAATALRECYERDVAALQSQLAESERKLGELRVGLDFERDCREADMRNTRTIIEQREALRAKLTEALKVGVWTDDESDGMLRAFYKAQEHRGMRESMFAVGAWLLRHRAALASPEPAGVEAGKAERTVRVVQRTRDEHPGIETDDPTPTETEAPARFRVGQRVRVTDGDHNGAIGRIVDIEFGRTWPYGVKFSNGYLRRFNAESLEPADPAPPKPGADPLTKLVAALQAIRGNYGGATHCFANDLIRELERKS